MHWGIAWGRSWKGFVFHGRGQGDLRIFFRCHSPASTQRGSQSTSSARWRAGMGDRRGLEVIDPQSKGCAALEEFFFPAINGNVFIRKLCLTWTSVLLM